MKGEENGSEQYNGENNLESLDIEQSPDLREFDSQFNVLGHKINGDDAIDADD